MSQLELVLMEQTQFYILFSTELDKNSDGICLVNRYDPPLNLENYSIALTDIQFSEPSILTDNAVLLITLDCLDATVIYGAEQQNLQLLRLFNPRSGINNFWYRSVSKTHCDALNVSFLDHALNPLNIRKHGCEAYLTLHCRREQNS